MTKESSKKGEAMKITPEMLDKDARKATIWQSALGPTNVDECLCVYLNALLESGKAEISTGHKIGDGPISAFPKYVSGPEGFPVIILRLGEKP